MKKLLILSIAVFTLFSCSSDDNNSDSSIQSDLIIGKWNLSASTAGSLSSCIRQSNIELKQDGTYNLIQYYEDSNGCNIGYTLTNKNWSKNSDGTYNVKFVGDSSGENINVSFSNNNSTMTTNVSGGLIWNKN